MNQPVSCTTLIAFVFSLASVTAVAQTERKLELQTDDGLIDVPLADGAPLQILSNGDISATAVSGFSCPTGGASCDDVRVSLDTGNGGSFTLTPNPVELGRSVTINWKGIGAWQCEGSGLPGTTWDGENPKQPTGQQSVKTDGLVAGNSYPVELTCSNGPVSDVRTISLAIEEDTGPEAPVGCEEVGELGDFADWAPASSILRNDSTHDPEVFADIFNEPFPGTTNTAHMEIRKGRYASIQFTTPSMTSSDSGQFNSEAAGQIYPGGDRRLVAISRCPGVFNPPDLEDEDCIKSLGITQGFYWFGPDHPDDAFRCTLQSNTTYYLNILYSQSAVGTYPPKQAECESGETVCGSLLYHTSNLQSN